jgi:UPF0755 protein
VSKKSFRMALVVVSATLLILGGVGLYVWRIVSGYAGRPHAGKGREVTFKIPKGMRFAEIADLLAREGLISRPSLFRYWFSDKANAVQACTYTLRDDLSPTAVVEALVQRCAEWGATAQVTIPEGKNLREVFAAIERAGIATAAELEAVARDKVWLREHGIEGETAEGYLFPDTYELRKPSKASAVLDRLVKRHREVYDEERKKHAKSLERLQKDLKWGDREIVIMASIVEKETADPSERRRVSSVFYNRLTLPSFKTRRLETDPTIRYGCTIPTVKSDACLKWDPAGRLFRAQLDDTDNKYNTYRHAGLPPGPISNPGRESLAAAMDPEKSEYLFFVAKDERSHVFSKTFEEHNRWVDKYQR